MRLKSELPTVDSARLLNCSENRDARAHCLLHTWDWVTMFLLNSRVCYRVCSHVGKMYIFLSPDLKEPTIDRWRFVAS